MNQKSIPAPDTLFRSPLPVLVAILLTGAALLGLGAVGSLFLPDAIPALTRDLVRSGVTDLSSIRTWTVIHMGTICLGCLWSLMLSLGLWLETGKPGRGLNLLHDVFLWLHRGLKALGIAAAAIAAFRLVRYLAGCFGRDDGLYLAYVMLIPEGLMLTLTAGAYTLARRFVDGLCDCAASMAYTRLSGTLDRVTIPGICGTGFRVMGLLWAYVSLERLVTVIIVPGPRYSIQFADHPVLLLTGCMALLGSAANLGLGIWLKGYKRNTERLLYRAMRERLRKE